MSKRQSLPQTNTLFNYFQSPKSSGDGKVTSEKTPNQKQSKLHVGKDSDEDLQVKSKKRNRIMVMDSDSDDENPPTPSIKTKETKREPQSEDSTDDENNQKSANKSYPKKKKARLHSEGSSSDEGTRKSKKKTSNLSTFSYEKSSTSTPKSKGEGKGASSQSQPTAKTETRWLHESLDFLKPEKIRDANRNRPDDQNYNWRTLHVPSDYLNNLTPAMRQWWILKSQHMDSVLFFKVGKFYELYHMDATIGVNHLGFSYMKGEFAHSGFPETAYGRMAASLIEQGFKVARVEQTETPEMMSQRVQGKKVTKYDKVVRREICQISTKGACIYGAQMTDAKQELPCYMLALAEKMSSDTTKRYGVCFIDTSIGVFNLAEFEDDKHSSRLLALLAQHPPALILVERNRQNKATAELLNKLSNVKIENLRPNTEFYGASKTVDLLSNGHYFLNKNEEHQWPSVFKDLLEDGSFKPKYELAVKAFGACLWYLKDCEMDLQVVSMGKFEFYHPVDTFSVKNEVKRDYMVLDAVTIENLKLIGGTGTLMKTLDYCRTPFGKRLLQQWICRPYCDAAKIKDRQDAVKELLGNHTLLEKVRSNIFGKLPDLERQISKIHIFGNRFCAKYHPDSRAILYELQTYSKRKIFDLLTTLNGFEKTQVVAEIFQDCESRLLRKITQFKPKGMLPDLSKTLQFFREAFDHQQAEKEGKIVPQSGMYEDYDGIEEEIENIQKEADDYLKTQCQFFGCTVHYFGTDKKRFQIEVPESKAQKATYEYQLEGTKKGSKPAKRYSTSFTKDILARLLKAEAEKSKIVQDLNRRIFEKFGDRYEEWNDALQCLMILDVLCSFAEYARVSSGDICMPIVNDFSENQMVKIGMGRHPSIVNIENFVPNDTELGTDNHAKLIILTGPNMGGKSTLMRQVSLIIIMAQLGSFVPAEFCELNMVDRIFTRLGAHDDILKRQSTFFVELSEAAAILKHATKHSFVLLDELGRGTSTHDGCAIATAYVKKLTELQCRTIFSTHYHSLVENFVGRSDIQLGHMACTVENEGHVTEESVTFLYKLAEGICPKSYGFNVARLSGLPAAIITRAHELAIEMEQIAKNRKMTKNLLRFISDGDISKSREILMSD